MIRVAIVGAGIIGLAVAEELTQRGVEVELFEINAAPGQEASGAAAGILSPWSEARGPGPFLDLLIRGYELIPETITRLTAETGIDLRFRASGMVEVAFTDGDDRELDQDWQWRKRQGLQVEKLTAEQVRNREPAVDGPIRWGLWTAQSAQLDNTRMVEAYARVVRKRGGLIRAPSRAIHFWVEKGQAVGVETELGKVSADWVIDCAGAWAGFDERLGFSIPTRPVKGQMLQYRTPKPIFQKVVKSPRAYFVQRSEDRLIVGTTVEQAGFNKELTEEGSHWIRKGAAEISSQVEKLPLEKAWSGLRPGTPDHLPILGPTPVRRLLLAAGHFRNGILLAPLTGRLMADWVVRGRSSLDLAPFSVTRFS